MLGAALKTKCLNSNLKPPLPSGFKNILRPRGAALRVRDGAARGGGARPLGRAARRAQGCFFP